MINKLKEIFDKDITQLLFANNCYNSEDFFRSSINNDFAGWYNKSDISKKCNFIIDKCKLKRNDKLLDMACGHGKHSEYFAEHGLKVTGIDISDKLIKYLEEKYPTIRFYKKRMEEASLDDDYNCIVIIGNSLSLIDKDKCMLTLKKMYKDLQLKSKVVIELDNKKKFINEEAGTKTWNYYNNRWLVISEHHYDEKNNLEKTRDIGIDFKCDLIDETFFIKKLYDEYEFKEIVNNIGFKNIDVYGDWNGNNIKDDSDQMIFIFEK